LENSVRKSFLLKALLATAFPLFATDYETASAVPSSTEPAADAAPVADVTVATDAPAAATMQVQIDPPAVVLDTAAATPVVEPEAPAASDAPSDESPVGGAPVDLGEGDDVAPAPTVQTPTPIAQSGDAGDPVLETVKTPAHSVADEIQEQIKNLEQLPAEVAAWFESKFVELAGHIKALL
jgi:hypothetical protein